MALEIVKGFLLKYIIEFGKMEVLISLHSEIKNKIEIEEMIQSLNEAIITKIDDGGPLGFRNKKGEAILRNLKSSTGVEDEGYEQTLDLMVFKVRDE